MGGNDKILACANSLSRFGSGAFRFGISRSLDVIAFCPKNGHILLADWL